MVPLLPLKAVAMILQELPPQARMEVLLNNLMEIKDIRLLLPVAHLLRKEDIVPLPLQVGGMVVLHLLHMVEILVAIMVLHPKVGVMEVARMGVLVVMITGEATIMEAVVDMETVVVEMVDMEDQEMVDTVVVEIGMEEEMVAMEVVETTVVVDMVTGVVVEVMVVAETTVAMVATVMIKLLKKTQFLSLVCRSMPQRMISRNTLVQLVSSRLTRDCRSPRSGCTVIKQVDSQRENAQSHLKTHTQPPQPLVGSMRKNLWVV